MNEEFASNLQQELASLTA